MIIVSQFNPPQEIEIPRKDLVSVHRIVFAGDADFPHKRIGSSHRYATQLEHLGTRAHSSPRADAGKRCVEPGAAKFRAAAAAGALFRIEGSRKRTPRLNAWVGLETARPFLLGKEEDRGKTGHERQPHNDGTVDFQIELEHGGTMQSRIEVRLVDSAAKTKRTKPPGESGRLGGGTTW